MAHSLSAKKRIRQTAKRRLRNRERRRLLKVQVKKLDGVFASGDGKATEAEVRTTIQKIDRTAARGTLHKNTAARRKSKLMKRLNALKAAPAAAAKA